MRLRGLKFGVKKKSPQGDSVVLAKGPSVTRPRLAPKERARTWGTVPPGDMGRLIRDFRLLLSSVHHGTALTIRSKTQFTVCVSEAELWTKSVLPLYVALMVCVPAVSFEVVNSATPPLRATTASFVLPS